MDELSDPLLYTVADGVATLCLNRPDKLNALNAALIEAIVARLSEAGADEGVRAILVTGSGRGFCSGADVGKMDADLGVTPVAVETRLRQGLQRIPMTLAGIDKPVLAAINGVAAGAGLDLALMCDLRFAGQSARMGESYAKLGLFPGAGGAYFLPRLVGAAKALEMLWDSEFVEAAEAERIGLVNRVYPDEELMARAFDYAVKLAKSPPISLKLIKRAVYHGLRSDLSASLDLAASYVAIARTSQDSAEAIRAFKDKRPGTFEGR